MTRLGFVIDQRKCIGCRAGGLRRPLWLLRPYKPDPSAYRVPETVGPERR